MESNVPGPAPGVAIRFTAKERREPGYMVRNATAAQRDVLRKGTPEDCIDRAAFAYLHGVADPSKAREEVSY